MPQTEPNASSDPTDPYSRTAQIFPTLSEEQIDRIKPFGKIESPTQSTILFERGQRGVDFFVLLQGFIEIYEHLPKGTEVITVHREHQFTGELDLFNDREILVGGRMGADGQVIRLDRTQFRKLMAAEPDVGEVIMQAFILRRMGLISHQQGSVTIISAQAGGDALRIERFLERNGYPLEILHWEEEKSQRLLHDVEISDKNLPIVLVPNQEPLRNPSNLELAQALGLVEPLSAEHTYDVAIIGAGPAGLSATVYAASEGLSTVLLEAEAPGGQAGTSSKIENYLGFPLGISGQALAGRAQVQAHKFGATIALPYSVEALNCHAHPYQIQVNNQQLVHAKTIIIASGARYRKLEVENEDHFESAGIYYAATAMEGELCRNEEAIVIGGGNSAGQAAVFLSRYARHVHILVRSSNLASSMSDYLVQRIQAANRITLHTNTEVTTLQGERYLEQVTWRNNETGDTEDHNIRHIFLMIGAVPNTQWLHDCLQLDEKGFICTGTNAKDWPIERPPMMLETSVPGVFAVGDVRSGSVKRVASAVGEGAMSVSQLHQVMAEINNE